VQGYEHRSALRVGGCGSIVERGILISLSRLNDLKASQLQRTANLYHEIQNDLALADARCASRARVRPTMGRIQHDDVEPRLLALRAKWRSYRPRHSSL
jgi:hypothetical protein